MMLALALALLLPGLQTGPRPLLAGPAAEPVKAPAPAAAAQAPAEVLKNARNHFEYGDYAEAAQLLSPIIEEIEPADLRIDAYRILGLSFFYQRRRGEAHAAFLDLLRLDPDQELDPFYVPPTAVAFFDEVKAQADAELAPLRARKRAEAEGRRRRLEEEASRRKQQELESQLRQYAALNPTIERRVIQREFWVSLLPFGIGQLQNGDRSLGIFLASSQAITGAASAGSAVLIEGLRDRSTGRFDSGTYPLANRMQVVKWVGAALFYGLWIGGAIHAAVKFEPQSAPIEQIVARPALEATPVTLPPGIELRPPAKPAPATPPTTTSPTPPSPPKR